MEPAKRPTEAPSCASVGRFADSALRGGGSTGWRLWLPSTGRFAGWQGRASCSYVKHSRH